MIGGRSSGGAASHFATPCSIRRRSFDATSQHCCGYYALPFCYRQSSSCPRRHSAAAGARHVRFSRRSFSSADTWLASARSAGYHGVRRVCSLRLMHLCVDGNEISVRGARAVHKRARTARRVRARAPQKSAFKFKASQGSCRNAITLQPLSWRRPHCPHGQAIRHRGSRSWIVRRHRHALHSRQIRQL